MYRVRQKSLPEKHDPVDMTISLFERYGVNTKEVVEAEATSEDVLRVIFKHDLRVQHEFLDTVGECLEKNKSLVDLIRHLIKEGILNTIKQ